MHNTDQKAMIIGIRKNFKILFGIRATNPFPTLQYIIKKSYYASNFDNYFKKWGHDETTKKQFGMFYRYIGVYIENGKWKKLLVHPIYSISMYFLRFLIGVVYILSKFNISKKENVYKDNKN